MGAIPGGCDTNNPKPAGIVSLLGGWPYTASSTTCLQVLALCFDSGMPDWEREAERAMLRYNVLYVILGGIATRESPAFLIMSPSRQVRLYFAFFPTILPTTKGFVLTRDDTERRK